MKKSSNVLSVTVVRAVYLVLVIAMALAFSAWVILDTRNYKLERAERSAARASWE